MEDQVLVAYATKYGSTAEIAERIGQVLRSASLPVQILPVEQVRDIAAYRAVIIGSAVYIGRWRKAAVQFLQAHQDALSRRPVWLFSSGPVGEGIPDDLLKGWRLPEKLKPVADRIQPRDQVIFHGSLDAEKLNLLEKWMINTVKSPIGDFRDWEAIDDWAQGIAAELGGDVAAQDRPSD